MCIYNTKNIIANYKVKQFIKLMDITTMNISVICCKEIAFIWYFNNLDCNHKIAVHPRRKKVGSQMYK